MPVTFHRTVMLCASLLGTALPAAAQAGDALVLLSSDKPPYKAVEGAFRSSLGQTPRAMLLSQAGDLKVTAAGAAVVLAIGPDAARAAGAAKLGVPLLLALVPSGTGHDARAALVPMFVPASRQLRTIRVALPNAKRLGLLFDPAQSTAMAAECEAALAGTGMSLVRQEVLSKKDVANAVRGLLGNVDALWMIPDTTVVSAEAFRFIMQESLSSKVPVIGFSEGMAKAGAVLAIQADYEEIGRKAGAAARRVLAGGAAAPESPEGSIYLNARSAKLLGTQVPDGLKAQAAKVFE